MLRRGHYRNFVIGFASPILNLDSAKKASEGDHQEVWKQQ